MKLLALKQSHSSALLCPDCREDSEWESRGGDGDDDRPDQTREQQVSAGLRRLKRFVRKPSVQTETKYIELMVVNDYDMVSRSQEDVLQAKLRDASLNKLVFLLEGCTKKLHNFCFYEAKHRNCQIISFCMFTIIKPN